MAEGIKLVFQYFPLLMQGLLYTILVSVEAIIIALVIGTLLSVIRMASSGFIGRIIKAIIKVYISFVRGTPILVQIFLIYQALAVLGLNLSAFISGVIALSLNSGGFIAEIIRGGITAVPKGHIEAGQALGMTNGQIWKRIILPQVFNITAPQLTSEFINVIKVSPMLSVIAIVELTQTAQNLGKMTYNPLPFYIAIAVLYFIVCAALEEIVKRQENKKVKA